MQQIRTLPAPLGAAGIALIITIISAAGCRSYEPRPLALDATQRAFLERAVDGPALDGFAARLREVAPNAVAFEPADGISLREAEAIALVFNRELRLARLAAGVTRANAENAGLWQDPQLGVDLSRIVSGTTGGGIEAFASIAFTLPLTGRLELEKQQAKAEHHAELARVAQEEWRVIAALRRAWAERAALVAEADAARDVLERVAQVLAVVDRMESAGEVARIEARLFRIEEQRLAAQRAEIDAALARATREIEQLLGLPPRDDRRFDAGFAAFSDIAAEPQDALVTRLARTGPSIAVARTEHEVAERRLAREIRAQWPDLELAPGFGEQDGDTQAVLGLGLTLPVLNGNRRGIAEADAARELARGRAEAELERSLGALFAAESRRASARSRGDALEKSLVPLVELQYAEAREVARLGEVNTLVLLETLKQQLEANHELIAAQRDAALAAVDIDEITGPAEVRATEEAKP